jgi:alkanesulfonate monooxygenase SsuD/methylene tetrahydromethanopterin reductase-like flavin-dependent oxidoreductase (luciferase family)
VIVRKQSATSPQKPDVDHLWPTAFNIILTAASSLERFGRDPLPVGVHSPGHVAATDEQAREQFWPHYLETIRGYSKIRRFAVPTEDSFLHEVGPHGALYVGSPETVTQKIATNMTTLGANRFDLKYGMPGLAQQAVMTNIELYAAKSSPGSAKSLRQMPRLP